VWIFGRRVLIYFVARDVSSTATPKYKYRYLKYNYLIVKYKYLIYCKYDLSMQAKIRPYYSYRTIKLHAVLSVSLAESPFTTSSQETSEPWSCSRDLTVAAKRREINN